MSHPKDVLSHLLSEISSQSSRHYEKYGNFVNEHREQTEAFLYNCLRPHVIRLFEEGKSTDVEAIRALGGDLRYPGRAIYLHIIWESRQRGKGWVRFYVGQAYNLTFRVYKQHLDFRWRRDHKSFHYFAMDRSAFDTFIVLAVLPRRIEQPDLVMNVLETWCALLFRTLQPVQLSLFLPPGANMQQKWGHLNVALPLDTGDEMTSKTAFRELQYSADPLALEYYNSRLGERWKRASTELNRVPNSKLLAALITTCVAFMIYKAIKKGRARAFWRAASRLRGVSFISWIFS